ncbi:MAG: CinA family protein [Actinobacteria bacterium]|nr:CinA family protein [Actinomycetota bacterium]NBY15897.1 CinA family protein [Actinomycetota bacterium]
MSETFDLALKIVKKLEGRTVATAESVTAGLVGAALTAVPGASGVYRGGLIPYATDLKANLLDIPPFTMSHGPVSGEVVAAMAVNAANLLDADFGIATTGVAGPDSQDNHEVGTVYVAVFRRGRAGMDVLSKVAKLQLTSAHADPVAAREDIRSQAVVAALELLDAAVPTAE